MSSALAMVLTAAMAVGDVPGKDMGEVEESLHLDGEWTGTLLEDNGEVWQLELGEGELKARSDKEVASPLHVGFIIDEGCGRLRIDWPLPYDALGIYKQEGDYLEICLRDGHQRRPTSFQAINGQGLFILHRVKPRK
jgi:hypothetical protein